MSSHWVRGLEGPRAATAGDVWDGLVGEFVELISAALPPTLGPLRNEVEPLWLRIAELFGTAAAWRGLAAGEVVDEMQLLREYVIRELYRDPPLGGRVPLSLRDVLRLNRAIDRAVTHASVGHVDAMFFQLFDGQAGAGISHDPAEVASEIRDELLDIRRQLSAIRALSAHPAGSEEH